MSDVTHSLIGAAWLELAHELREELQQVDPAGRVGATLDPGGSLQLEMRVSAQNDGPTRALAQRYERQARQTCEHCGGCFSTTVAGRVITILCTNCITDG